MRQLYILSPIQKLYIPTQITLNWKPRFKSLRSICDVILSKPTWLRGYTDCWGACLSWIVAIVARYEEETRDPFVRFLGSKRLELQRFEVGNCSRRGIWLLSLRKISVALLEKGKGPPEPLVSSGLRAACTPGGIRESFKDCQVG